MMGFLKSNRINSLFSYSSLSAFTYFTDSVRIEASLDNSFINLKTIGFLPPLFKKNLSFHATGILRGTVSNIRTDQLRITSK